MGYRIELDKTIQLYSVFYFMGKRATLLQTESF